MHDAQAAAYFRWADWLRAAAIKAGKRPLFINLDETSISRSWPQSKGNIITKQLYISKHKPPKVKACRAEYRGSVTGVAMITHDEVLQRVLPQVYIGNGHVFPKDLLEAATVGLPGVVHFWREASSWNSPMLMCKILSLLASSLAAYPHVQPIVVFDAASIHIHRSVLEQSIRSKICLMCVPASTTWLLQPLDTHVFAGFKGFLRKRWRDLMATGSATFQSWIKLLSQVSTSFLWSHDWSTAFVQDGLMGNRRCLGQRPAAFLGDAVAQVASAPAQPAPEQVALCLPRKAQLHYPMWLHQPQGRKRWIFLIAYNVKKTKQKRNLQPSLSREQRPGSLAGALARHARITCHACSISVTLFARWRALCRGCNPDCAHNDEASAAERLLHSSSCAQAR